jgi:spore maturation protein CgeB
MRIVVLGLSLSSSWGNGHATTWRALLSALSSRGHRILFLERDVPWYAEHRDLPEPDFCDLRLYKDLSELAAWRTNLGSADLVIVGSYVPEGIGAIRFVQRHASGVTAFYDIDTPVTMARLAAGDLDYLAPDQIAGFDLYLSFTGGPILRRIEQQYGARAAHALYCSVDPTTHARTDVPLIWDIGYIGTYSSDRQDKLERLLITPARQDRALRCVVAGPLYPAEIDWPSNVTRIEHLPPSAHADFYSSLSWTLNLTRSDMAAAGWSPSVRLFEAAACGSAILSDAWPGLEDILTPGVELELVHDTADVLQALQEDAATRRELGENARRRVLAEHTAQHRAAQLEEHVAEAVSRRAGGDNLGDSRLIA